MSAPIRVTHLITGLATGGAETLLLNLLRRTNRNRIQNDVVSLTPGGELKQLIESIDIPVTHLGMTPGVPNPVGMYRLHRHLRRVRPDVLQTWLYHADLLGSLVVPISSVNRLVWNIRCSDMGAAYYRGTTGLVVKALAALSRRTDAIVVNSQAGKREHEGFGYRPGRWEVISNGVDLDRFQPSPQARAQVRRELGIPKDAIVIGLVARFDPVKGHDVFLQAAKIALAGENKLHFVLVGDGCMKDNSGLAPIIADIPAEQVHLLGRRHDIARLVTAFDIACCSSYSEGFPNILIEAMACAVPCVATNVGDCAEIVADTGLVVDAGDPSAFAGSLRKLAEMGREERSLLGQSARRRAWELYDLGSMVTNYESLYSDLSVEPRKLA